MDTLNHWNFNFNINKEKQMNNLDKLIRDKEIIKQSLNALGEILYKKYPTMKTIEFSCFMAQLISVNTYIGGQKPNEEIPDEKRN